LAFGVFEKETELMLRQISVNSAFYPNMDFVLFFVFLLHNTNLIKCSANMQLK